jgi:DNA mismatch repair protein MutL
MESSLGPFSRATYLGQFRNCYLLLECDSELWVIDQHAFHERILFEELVSAAKKESRIARQELLTPILVPVPRGIGELVDQEKDEWERLGFTVECLGSDKVAIHAYPTIISLDKISKTFDDILARMIAILGAGTSDVHPLLAKASALKPELMALGLHSQSLATEAVYHMLYATIACHAAVRAGEPLNAELVRRLLSRAKDVDFYAHCPHGRPVWRRFTEADVALWFARV